MVEFISLAAAKQQRLEQVTWWRTSTTSIDTMAGRLPIADWLAAELRRILRDPTRRGAIVRRNGSLALFLDEPQPPGRRYRAPLRPPGPPPVSEPTAHRPQVYAVRLPG